jgi:mannan endo-1,4-beta-mannosidase
MIVALDLLWGSLVGSTGSLVYGLVDEPAHLATCALMVLVVATVTGVRPPVRFVAAALIASVAIDLDHLPGYLGSHLIGGDLPRPGTHGLFLVLSLLGLVAALKPGPGRQMTLGAAFGVSAHLLRDLATGPGVPMFWPVSDHIAAIPYAFVVAFLALGVVAIALPRRALAAGHVAAIAAMALTLAVGASAFAAEPAEATPEVGVGAYISGADQDPSLIDDFSAEVGRPVSFLISYKAWSQDPFVHDQLDGIWEHGAIPMITWEPWGHSLSGIASGYYDGYLWDAARAAASWDKPLMIRFGQEMNGDWFAWGGHPNAFKAAWRHLVRVFRAAGADQVRWVWNPYVNSRDGRLPFAPFFPGNKWVDWVGLDVINWGGPHPWRTFGQILGLSYRDLTKLSSKPVIIAETGSGEQGGSKAQWLSTMLRRDIPDMRHVRAVAFWSAADPRGDLRVDSSPASLAAVRRGLSRPLYESSRWRLLRTPTRLGR